MAGSEQLLRRDSEFFAIHADYRQESEPGESCSGQTLWARVAASQKKSDCRNPLRQPDRLFVQIVQLASSAAHITGDSSAGADTSSDSVK